MLLGLNVVWAQDAFIQSNTINVTVDGVSLDNPWVGGLNSVQVSEVDLNYDGRLDLILFDRLGERLIPYINNGLDYVYAPDYIKDFPEITDWMLMVDFNVDGKMDIFCSTNGGIKVYKNTGSIDDGGLKFEYYLNFQYILFHS